MQAVRGLHRPAGSLPSGLPTGVDEADAYLLVLGGRYGEPVFDSDLAPTEEEFTWARQRGIPMLVVAGALGEFAVQQAPLVFTPLPATIDLAVPWIYDPAARAEAFSSHAAILECLPFRLLHRGYRRPP